MIDVHKHIDGSTNARGVDNHEISSVPLAIDSGLTVGATGEIILMLNEHA